MHPNILLRRAIALSAGFAVALGSLAGAIAPANAAAPLRTATTSTDTTYLADTLGLPADTVVEPVTYDRFQWLLRQPGQFAFLIGSTTDANFKANAVKVDLAAKAAGAAKVYWFDPNLTGQQGVKNLDIRNSSGINLAASSQVIYGNLWRNLLGQYLGNGVKSVPSATQTSVTITADDTVVNDAVDPLFDVRTGKSSAIASTEDAFLVYDKDHAVNGAADKVVSWVNLSTNTDAQAAVGSALTAAGGGAVIDQLGQFAWWKDAANSKHKLAYADDKRYGGDIITDADSADGWRVQQVTYPELLHLLNLNDSADRNFVILFGGTWCHNTRAVLKYINAQAQANGVAKVYNFDLVLDGGTVNGTNSGSNPIHVRDNAYSGTTFNFRPSWVYGDLVRTYLRNLVTEYDPNTGTRVAFYPNGDLTAFPDVVRKLQVPFLVNYQRGTAATPASTSIKHQWIQQNADASTGLATFKEYMSEWWFTNPSAQLGLDFTIPKDESTLTAAQVAQLAQARSSVAFAADGLAKLAAFFTALPGPAAPKPVVVPPKATPALSASVAKRPTSKVAGAYKVTIAVAAGVDPASGSVTVTFTKGSVARTVTGTLTDGVATIAVPKLGVGTWSASVAYAGDAHYDAATLAGASILVKA